MSYVALTVMQMGYMMAGLKSFNLIYPDLYMIHYNDVIHYENIKGPIIMI
jgi:hypothetical protein